MASGASLKYTGAVHARNVDEEDKSHGRTMLQSVESGSHPSLASTYATKAEHQKTPRLLRRRSVASSQSVMHTSYGFKNTSVWIFASFASATRIVHLRTNTLPGQTTAAIGVRRTPKLFFACLRVRARLVATLPEVRPARDGEGRVDDDEADVHVRRARHARDRPVERAPDRWAAASRE
jgi:hypothetical protein